MASGQSWTAPESLAQTSAGYDLRPLSTGEVLDRTFQLYRSRFALFASLAALPAAISFVSGAIQVLTMQGERVVGKLHVSVTIHPWATYTTRFLTFIVYYALYGITQAATTWAVAEIYLGKAAALRTAWKAAVAHWLRYVLVTLRQYWSVFWLPGIAFGAMFTLILINAKHPSLALSIGSGVIALLAIATLVYAVYAAIRVSLAVPASVIESLGPNAAVRRSIALLVERKGRILVAGLLVFAMSMIVGVALSPLLFLTMRAQGAERYVLQMGALAGSFFSRLLIGPVLAIALCLFYFDERVRHEGFDIEFLMQRTGGPDPNSVVEESTSPEPA